MSGTDEILFSAAAEPLDGYLDHADWTSLTGWAFSPGDPDEPVWLDVTVDDRAPIRILANLLREDLVQAGIGTGRHGFRLFFSRRLDPTIAHRLTISRAGDGAPLRNTPWLLPAAPAGNASARAKLEAVISAEIEAARTGENLAPMTRFLVAQTDRLLQAATDIDSGRSARRLFRARWNETLDGEPQQVPPPDTRRLALVVGFDLPSSAQTLALLAGLQALNLRVGVVAMRGLPGDGPAAEALRDAGHDVHGTPWFGAVEDLIRRNAPDYRVILLHGPVAAAAYAVTAKLHHPQAQVLAWIDDPQQDVPIAVAAQLLCDATLTSSQAAAEALRRRVQGRPVHVLPDEAAALVPVLRQAIAPSA
jgi:hypothetical protein